MGLVPALPSAHDNAGYDTSSKFRRCQVILGWHLEMNLLGRGSGIMKLFSVILFLATISVLYASAQSGRRVVTTRTTTTAPIQPPLTPEPELPASKTSSTVSELLFLPESLREREIKPIGGESTKLEFLAKPGNT